MRRKILLFGILAVVAIGGVTAYFYHPKQQVIEAKSEDQDIYLKFTAEVYDKIKDNYWDKIADDKLTKLYQLAAEKILNQPQNLETTDKAGVQKLVAAIIKDYPLEKKQEFVTALSDIVLANLQPFGRSRLYTTKQEEALKNTVQNIDAQTDLYQTLGLVRNASPKEIESGYQKKVTELKSDKSPEAADKLALVNRAYQALAKPENKKTYDQTKVEPTVIAKLITPDIYYIHLTKFSPQSFDELEKAANAINPDQKGGPTALIFDLRDNIGGAIDILQYFLGPFIGPDQYAYEFFHQGEKTPFKTKVGWLKSLVRYKKVVILTNKTVQSSAEVMTATLKKYHVGVVVGTRTKGWGTVEQVETINQQITANEKYSLFIAHSLTLRDDGQPIENNGVDPDVNIADSDWPQQLMVYFNYPELVRKVKELVQGH